MLKLKKVVNGAGNELLRQWCSFIRDRRWSRQQKYQLLAHFATLTDLYAASPESLGSLIELKRSRKPLPVSFSTLDQDMAWLARPEHHLIHCHDSRYPKALKEIPDPPLALFAIGDVSLLSAPQVSIVGTRRPTPIGAVIADKIAARLAAVGINVVSGMALGIDGISHAGALNAGGTSTAVLGSGLDQVTPVRNRNLFQQLTQRGLVLSEYPPGASATRYTFPERNRIVSGLSLGVVIVEAAERSGTLITARLAAEQNREVMVVPGSVLSSQYQGSHGLLQQGAALVMNGDDVLHCLAAQLGDFLATKMVKECKTVKRKIRPEGDGILKYIGAESTTVNDLIFASGLTAAEVSSMLISLEIEGVIAAAGDGGYINLS